MKTNRKHFVFPIIAIALVAYKPEKSSCAEKPNFIIIFTDDQGYTDLGVSGAVGYKTPNIDNLATGGIRFTDFYVASSVCSPSRAALLTGCYPQRVGIPGVLYPEKEGDEPSMFSRTKVGLNEKETTIAEMLKEQGYATACVGKWHIGHHTEFLPLQQGFDEYLGLPYSNDMRLENNPLYSKLPLLKGNSVERYLETDLSSLTTEYTEYAVDFVKRNRDKPFFLYFAHSMPHVPLYVSDKFKGKSEQGLYGDVIMEIDWSVGQISQTLDELGIRKNTMVIFTCDNGPWLIYGNHGGSAFPLREGKKTTFEGGQRVQCIVNWPETISAGKVCHEIVTSLDVLPTIAHFAGTNLPSQKIDGHNISELLLTNGAKSPTEAFFFYRYKSLQAIRSGKWKLHVPHQYITIVKKGMDGKVGIQDENAEIGLSLFDLSSDPGEKNNLIDQYPEIVAKLMAKVETMRNELGDENKKGTGNRECGWTLETENPWLPK